MKKLKWSKIKLLLSIYYEYLISFERFLFIFLSLSLFACALSLSLRALSLSLSLPLFLSMNNNKSGIDWQKYADCIDFATKMTIEV